MSGSYLLIKGNTLLIQPNLAERIGLNQAIALQQIYYRQTTYEAANHERFFQNGRWWVCLSETDWAKKEFPWWSGPTISRIFEALEKMSLVDVGYFDYSHRRRMKWHTINFAAVEALERAPADISKASNSLEAKIRSVREYLKQAEIILSDEIDDAGTNDLPAPDSIKLIESNRSDQVDRIPFDQLDRSEASRFDQLDRMTIYRDLESRYRSLSELDTLRDQEGEIRAHGSIEPCMRDLQPNGSSAFEENLEAQYPPYPSHPKQKTASVKHADPREEKVPPLSSEKGKKAKKGSKKGSERDRLRTEFLAEGTGCLHPESRKAISAEPKTPEIAAYFSGWFARWQEFRSQIGADADSRFDCAIAIERKVRGLIEEGRYASPNEALEAIEKGSKAFIAQKLKERREEGRMPSGIMQGQRFLEGWVDGRQPKWEIYLEEREEGAPVFTVATLPLSEDYQWFRSTFADKARQLGSLFGPEQDAMAEWAVLFGRNPEQISDFKRAMNHYFEFKIQQDKKFRETGKGEAAKICHAANFIADKWRAALDSVNQLEEGKVAIAGQEQMSTFDLVMAVRALRRQQSSVAS